MVSAKEEARRHVSWKRATSFAGGRVGFLEIQDVDEGALNVGLMGGGYLGPHVALGASLDWHRSEFDPQERETFALTIGLEAYVLSYRYIIQPYFVGGLGLYRSETVFLDEFGEEIGRVDSETDFGFHAGTGMDINVGADEEGRIAINIEVRWIYSKPEPAGQDVEPDGAQITLGLRIKSR